MVVINVLRHARRWNQSAVHSCLGVAEIAREFNEQMRNGFTRPILFIVHHENRCTFQFGVPEKRIDYRSVEEVCHPCTGTDALCVSRRVSPPFDHIAEIQRSLLHFRAARPSARVAVARVITMLVRPLLAQIHSGLVSDRDDEQRADQFGTVHGAVCDAIVIALPVTTRCFYSTMPPP